MKTPVYIVKGNKRNRHSKPAFINGELRDRMRNSVTKIFVYHFDDRGDMHVDMIPLKFVQPAVFELEG